MDHLSKYSLTVNITHEEHPGCTAHGEPTYRYSSVKRHRQLFLNAGSCPTHVDCALLTASDSFH